MASIINIITTGIKSLDAKTEQIKAGSGDQGKTLKIKAQAGDRYQLQDAQTPKLTGPQALKLKRVGNDLEVILENGQKADVVIENYYTEITSANEGLMGQNSSGVMQSYVPVEASGISNTLNAPANQVVTAALSGPAIESGVGALLPAVAPSLGAIAGVTAGAAAVAAASSKSADPQAPTGKGKTIAGTEDTVYTINKADFGFADGDNNTFSGVKITSLPANGTLKLNGVDVTLNQVISAADIDAGKLVFAPAANANGTAYASLEFKVQDNGASNNEATTASKLTFDIAAANDKASITGTTTGSVTEDAATAKTATGTLKVADVDTGDAGFQAPASLAGTYGTFTFNTSSGVWAYVLENGWTAVQALTANQEVHDKLTIKSLDGTATETIDVTIKGSNDAATVSVSPVLSSLKEGESKNSVSGKAAVSDADEGEKTVKAQETNGQYGTFKIGADGQWTYKLNNDSDAVKALPVGKVVTETFSIQSADGTGSQDVVVQITGTNNTAAIVGKATGEVNEDAIANKATGTLNVSDVDTGEALVVAQSNVGGTYGTFSIGANGQWTYTLDNSKAAVQALAKDATVTDTFAVASKDGTATQTVNVTIKGTNDAPVITSGTQAGTVKEDNATLSDTFTVAAADGTQQVVTVTITGTNDAPTVANPIVDKSINEDAEFSFTVPANAFNDVDAGDSLSYTATLANGNLLPTWLIFNANTRAFSGTPTNGDVGTISVTVTAKDVANTAVNDTFDLVVVNVNDRPVATFNTDQIFREDSGVKTGQLTATDEETPSASLTYSLTQAIAGLTLNANGSWSFDTANSNYQYLGAYGEQEIEVNYSVSDGQDSGVGSFKITLNGVNDVATITGPKTGLVNANALVSVAGGSLVVSDVDSGENMFLGTGTVSTLASNGQFSFNYATGSWAYSPTQVTTPGTGSAKIYQDVLSGLKSMDQTASADVKVGIYVAGAADNTNLVLDGSASLDLSALHALDSLCTS